MRLLIFILLIFSLLISCDSNKEYLDAKYFINDYSSIDEECEDILIDILKTTGIERDNFQIERIYELNIKLNKKIYVDKIYKDGIFVLAVLSNDSIEIDDFQKYQFINIKPNQNRLNSCELIAHDSILLINTSWEFGTNMEALFKQSCFDFKPNQQGLKFDTRGFGFWNFNSNTQILGTWKKDFNKPSYFKNDLYNEQWYFEKEKLYFLDFSDDTLASTRYLTSNDSLYLLDLKDTLNLHTITNNGMVLSDFHKNKINFVYKTKEEIKK